MCVCVCVCVCAYNENTHLNMFGFSSYSSEKEMLVALERSITRSGRPSCNNHTATKENFFNRFRMYIYS